MLTQTGVEAHVEQVYALVETRRDALRLGMWVFLGSETLLFGGLFGLYAAYRVMYPEAFIRASQHNEEWIGSLNTFVLIVSSFFAALAVHAGRLGRVRAVRRSLLLVIALGLLFLGLKSLEYVHHVQEGIVPGATATYHDIPERGGRAFFSLYYLMTGLHALHVIAGLSVMLWLLVRTRVAALLPERHIELELGALYWHLVDIVWIFLWPLLYLIA